MIPRILTKAPGADEEKQVHGVMLPPPGFTGYKVVLGDKLSGFSIKHFF